MKKNLMNSVSVLALAVSASITVTVEAVAADDLWTGGFVGLGGGTWTATVPGESWVEGWSEGYDDDWNGDFGTPFEGDGGTSGFLSGDGQFYFADAGYDQQINNFVVGGFLGMDFGAVSATASLPTVWGSQYCEGPCDDSTLSGGIELGNRTTFGARVGYAIAPTTLVFGSFSSTSAPATLSVTQTLESFTEGGVDLTNTAVLDEGSISGTGIGFGVEQQFGNNWSVKAEYRTTTYSGVEWIGEGMSEGDLPDGYIDTYGEVGIEDLVNTTIRISVNKRF